MRLHLWPLWLWYTLLDHAAFFWDNHKTGFYKKCRSLPCTLATSYGFWVAYRYGLSYQGANIVLALSCLALYLNFLSNDSGYLVTTNAPELMRWVTLTSFLILLVYASVGVWFFYFTLAEHDWRLLMTFGLGSVVAWIAFLLLCHMIYGKICEYSKSLRTR